MPRFTPLGLTWHQAAACALEVYAQTRSLPGMAIREHTRLAVILEVWPGRVPPLQIEFRRAYDLYALNSICIINKEHATYSLWIDASYDISLGEEETHTAQSPIA